MHEQYNPNGPKNPFVGYFVGFFWGGHIHGMWSSRARDRTPNTAVTMPDP